MPRLKCGVSSCVDQTPTLTDVLEAVFRSFVAQQFTAMPGIVEAYDPVLQRVDVQPAIKATHEDEAGPVVEAEPIIPSVPVLFLGGGGSHLTHPIAKGDPVLLVFGAPIKAWLTLGGVVDPRAVHRNHLGDAIAIPGLRPRPQVIKPAPSTSAMVLTASDLRLGGADADQAVVVQSALDTFVDALQAGIDAAVPNDGGKVALTAIKETLGAWSAGTTKTKAT